MNFITENLQAKYEKLAKDIKKRGIQKNTKKIREDLLKLMHYEHLLGFMSVEYNRLLIDGETVSDQIRIKLSKARDYEGKAREITETGLPYEHNNAFIFAQYQYERANKIMCQMMITLMDYILQEKAGISVLYTDQNESGWRDLVNEIKSLDNDFLRCWCYLCAYDYCVEKIADYTGVVEYKFLTKEHERILGNNMSEKVTETIAVLTDAAGGEKIFGNVAGALSVAFTSKPKYSQKMLKKAYQDVITTYQVKETAFENLAKLIIDVSDEYMKAGVI